MLESFRQPFHLKCPSKKKRSIIVFWWLYETLFMHLCVWKAAFITATIMLFPRQNQYRSLEPNKQRTHQNVSAKHLLLSHCKSLVRLLVTVTIFDFQNILYILSGWSVTIFWRLPWFNEMVSFLEILPLIGEAHFLWLRGLRISSFPKEWYEDKVASFYAKYLKIF